jgi:hypothetical protein
MLFETPSALMTEETYYDEDDAVKIKINKLKLNEI